MAPVEKLSTKGGEEEEKSRSRDWDRGSEKSERKGRERHASSVRTKTHILLTRAPIIGSSIVNMFFILSLDQKICPLPIGNLGLS